MDGDTIGLIINLGIFLVLICLGFFSGTFLEKRHFKRLNKREAECKGVVVTQLKTFPGGVSSELPPKMFVAEIGDRERLFQIVSGWHPKVFRWRDAQLSDTA